MTHLPETIYVIRKGDMVYDLNMMNISRQMVLRLSDLIKPAKESPFKVQRIIERSCKFYGNSKKQKRIVLLEFLVNILPYTSFTYFPHSDRQEENMD